MYIMCIMCMNTDAVKFNHIDADVKEMHAVLGQYLKMAPHRQGGAGSGARIATMERSPSPVGHDDDQGDNDTDDD